MNPTESTSADPHADSVVPQHRASRRSLVKASLAAGLMAAARRTPVRAQEGATPVATSVTTKSPAPGVLFRDVRIFDGVSSSLSAPSSVLVSGNTIATISETPIEPPAGATVIDGGGRTLMPGLIDAHWHTMMATIPLRALLTADDGYLTVVAGQSAGETLLRGFTSVRDVGGPSFGVKHAIDEGVIAGPRIYPSGALISQTSGHGDFRQLFELPRTPTTSLSRGEKLGVGAIADGVDEVLRVTREQLMQGASQIKVMAGGGIASGYDPIDVTQYSQAEIEAAVGAAADWGTYVAVHAYTPRAIQRAIAAGVLSIEHGHLMDEATAEMMAERDVWLSLQPFLDDEDAIPYPEGSPSRAKQLDVAAGTDRAYELAIQYGLKLAWGTDTLFDPVLASKQGKQLAKMIRWFTPAEALAMATSANAELLALSGPRNPYPGTLGVVREGALADLLLVDGNPLENLTLVADPEQNLPLIMKDGRIYKQAPALT
ncbi:MAG: amidohydrolase family protein [Thermomicrobiales bacterium]|nr:amidohydrolase family protein [Thermomicrobiales bacterium]